MGDAFVARVDPFISDEDHLGGIAAAGFAEELQGTIDNSVGSIMYFN